MCAGTLRQERIADRAPRIATIRLPDRALNRREHSHNRCLLSADSRIPFRPICDRSALRPLQSLKSLQSTTNTHKHNDTHT
mmetsp:Transcript_12217/g.33613  ORF Transcript_12217/g.33613 Transcript_12217/m.33613 type:complete len:81 (-) Transcript_12217:304-546(-)